MSETVGLRIRQALLDAAEADYWQALASAPEIPFSAQYLRWEGRFLDHPVALAKRFFRPVWQKALRIAACLLLAAALSFGTLMATSAEAREWVQKWIAEWYYDHVAYIATENAPSNYLGLWEPTYLPEGYEKSDYVDLGAAICIYYNNNNPELEIGFRYMRMSEGNGFQLDNEWHTMTDININGMSGKFFEATDDGQNMVLWFDEETMYSFLLVAQLPRDTLMFIAESVVFVK